MRVGVVGHIEWIEFVKVDDVPAAGEIVHATQSFSEPAGGGAVAAVQLAKLAGGADLLTALGGDAMGKRSLERLGELGVRPRAATRQEPTRHGLTFIDSKGERTITTIGERLEPRGSDELDWEELEGADGVYVTAADVDGIRHARKAKVLVASPRVGQALEGCGVMLDALVFSDDDRLERELAARIDPKPALMVATRGTSGGRYEASGGSGGTWAVGGDGTWAAAPLPGRLADTYGCGDSFAAALTFALAEGREPDAALDLAARAGAACATGHGPYQAQLTSAD